MTNCRFFMLQNKNDAVGFELFYLTDTIAFFCVVQCSTEHTEVKATADVQVCHSHSRRIVNVTVLQNVWLCVVNVSSWHQSNVGYDLRGIWQTLCINDVIGDNIINTQGLPYAWCIMPLQLSWKFSRMWPLWRNVVGLLLLTNFTMQYAAFLECFVWHN